MRTSGEDVENDVSGAGEKQEKRADVADEVFSVLKVRRGLVEVHTDHCPRPELHQRTHQKTVDRPQGVR